MNRKRILCLLFTVFAIQGYFVSNRKKNVMGQEILEKRSIVPSDVKSTDVEVSDVDIEEILSLERR
jgi:hypothetical protein